MENSNSEKKKETIEDDFLESNTNIPNSSEKHFLPIINHLDSLIKNNSFSNEVRITFILKIFFIRLVLRVFKFKTDSKKKSEAFISGEDNISIDSWCSRTFDHIFFKLPPDIEKRCRSSFNGVNDLIDRILNTNVKQDDQPFFLSYVYDHLLEGTDKKKKKGIYYTPEKIANKMLKYSVENLNENKEWDLIDYSCGTGVFLVKALKHLYKHEDSVNCLQRIFGIDDDPIAIEIAAIGLLLTWFQLTGKIASINTLNLWIGNSLSIDNLIKDTSREIKHISGVSNKIEETSLLKDFSIVIGNPPYTVSAKTYETVPISRISGHKDLYLFFFIICLDHTKKRGIFSLIIPATFLVSSKIKDFRKQILKRYQILLIADFSNIPFKNVDPDTCALILRNEKPADSHKLKIEYQVNGRLYSHFIEQKIFLETQNKSIITRLQPEIHNTILKYQRFSLTIGNCYTIQRGVEIGKSNQKIFSFEPSRESKQILAADEISEYLIVPIKRYLYHDSSKPSVYKPIEWYSEKKIIMHGVKKLSYQKRLEAAYDTQGYLIFSSCYMIFSKSKNENGLFFLLGLLNSKLVNYYYSTINPNVRITKQSLEKIPLFANEELKNSIIEHVKMIIELNKQKVTIPSWIKDSLKTDISLDNQIRQIFSSWTIIDEKIGLIKERIEGFIQLGYNLTNEEKKIINISGTHLKRKEKKSFSLVQPEWEYYLNERLFFEIIKSKSNKVSIKILSKFLMKQLNTIFQKNEKRIQELEIILKYKITKTPENWIRHRFLKFVKQASIVLHENEEYVSLNSWN